MQTSFRSIINNRLRSTHGRILLSRIELGKAISNTWRMVIDNKDLMLITNLKKW